MLLIKFSDTTEPDLKCELISTCDRHGYARTDLNFTSENLGKIGTQSVPASIAIALEHSNEHEIQTDLDLVLEPPNSSKGVFGSCEIPKEFWYPFIKMVRRMYKNTDKVQSDNIQTMLTYYEYQITERNDKPSIIRRIKDRMTRRKRYKQLSQTLI